jgi:AraC-like DNA-binding protein
MLEHDYRDAFHDHEHLWADAHTELIFTTGSRYFRKRGSRRAILPPGFVIGPFQKELELFSNGRTALVAARFWPWGFHALSKLPMSELKNTVRSCREALGEPATKLARQLAETSSLDARIAALERTLLRLLAPNAAPLLSRPLADDISRTRGMIRISELAPKHRIHGRRMERIFLEEIGIPAKMFSRIVRFNHAMKVIERNPEVDLLSLTYECGYADQAHFTRNFREMFNITPAEFKARMKKAAAIFRATKPDVVFLQDRAVQNR